MTYQEKVNRINNIIVDKNGYIWTSDINFLLARIYEELTEEQFQRIVSKLEEYKNHEVHFGLKG